PIWPPIVSVDDNQGFGRHHAHDPLAVAGRSPGSPAFMCTLMMQANTVACSGPSAPPVTIKRSVVATERDGQQPWATACPARRRGV
uniref:hypothetical protein n=1 Tax=Candidatus Mycobacterium methanotrophicum TaxID=2943498 RepID=UPI001C572C08